MSGYIHNLINKGESQHLDFKQSITDAAKIAKTLVAYANSGGGTLLIGVKDNSRISGVRDEDEQYMVGLAAKFYCKPEVEFHLKEWEVEGKTVLECQILDGKLRPYLAKDESGKWLAYIRIDDETLKASRIALEVMKRTTNGKNTLIEYKDEEKILFDYLSTHDHISLQKFQKLIGGSRWMAQRVLINLISAKIVHYKRIEKEEYYTLK